MSRFSAYLTVRLEADRLEGSDPVPAAGSPEHDVLSSLIAAVVDDALRSLKFVQPRPGRQTCLVDSRLRTPVTVDRIEVTPGDLMPAPYEPADPLDRSRPLIRKVADRMGWEEAADLAALFLADCGGLQFLQAYLEDHERDAE